MADTPLPAPLPASARRVLRACLATWPRDRRRSHGEPLLRTAESLLADEAARGRGRFLRHLAGEAAGLLREGLAMRATALARGFAALLADTASDVRTATRGLLRAPAFTFLVVATLALAIGANATVFGLVRAVLLAPPPYERAEDLLLVWNTLPGSEERIPVAGPDAAELRDRTDRLAGVAFHGRTVDGAVEARMGDAAEHVRLAPVSPDFFEVLGVEPLLGNEHGGVPARSGPDDPVAAVILAHDAWRRLFGGDPGVVGRRIRLNGMSVEVAAVMPSDFRLVLPPDAGVDTRVDVWTPLLVPLESLHRDERLLDRDSDNTGAVVARLAPGSTPALAREEVRRVGRELAAEIPGYAEAGLGLDARPLHADATGHARGLLGALLAGAAGLLVVACLDVAGLVAARAAGRADQVAIRAALGAGRGRLLRGVVVEAAVLVALGLAAVLALGPLASAAMWRLVPPDLAAVTGGRPAGGGLDPLTLVFAVGLSLLAVVLAGVLPARRIAATGSPGLLRGRHARTGTAARRALVVGEVALSVVLLLGAGLLLRTVHALDRIRPGFDAEHAVTFDVSLRVPGRHASPGGRAVLMKDVENRLSALPGVEAVGWVGVLPLSGDRWTQPWGLPGQPVDAWRHNRADFRVASSGWFEAMGARLLEGRGFTDREDLEEDERVVVIDRTLATTIAPEGSALDATIGVPVDGAPVEARVVGVVEPIRYETLEADGREAIYVPYRQEASRDVSFVVRTRPGAGDPVALGPAIRAAVREVDPTVPVYGLRTLEAWVDGAVAPRRFALRVIALFAVLGLVCSAMGLYGTVAFDVARRTREIGVRMAVGATRRRTVGHVVGSGMRLAGAGLALGVPLALLATRSLRSLVFGVGAADPLTWTAVIATVAAVTLVGTWLPAWRASRVDPARALRSD